MTVPRIKLQAENTRSTGDKQSIMEMKYEDMEGDDLGLLSDDCESIGSTLLDWTTERRHSSPVSTCSTQQSSIHSSPVSTCSTQQSSIQPRLIY